MTAVFPREEGFPVLSPVSPATPQGSLVARMLGRFEVHVHGCAVDRWRAGRARSLFQYLLMHRDRLVTRDRLYEVLWPGSDLGPRTSSLKVACHGVRQALGASRDGGWLRLVSRDYGYVLQVDNAWVDVTEFERLVEAGLDAAGRGQDTIARGHLSTAMRLYTGDFLEGDNADWVVEHREYLKSLALRALQELRATAEQTGDHSSLISVCHRTLDLDRYHEPTYRTLVSLHGRLGEIDRACGWFRLCVSRLNHDLGVEPAPSTVAAFRTAVGDVRSRPLLHPVHP